MLLKVLKLVSLEGNCNNHDGKACSHCYDARGIKSCRELYIEMSKPTSDLIKV
jgi:hypothetical protein